MANTPWEKARETHTVAGYVKYAEFSANTGYRAGIAWGYSAAAAILMKHKEYQRAVPYLEKADEAFGDVQLKPEDTHEWHWVNWYLGLCSEPQNGGSSWAQAARYFEKAEGLAQDQESREGCRKAHMYCAHMAE